MSAISCSSLFSRRSGVRAVHEAARNHPEVVEARFWLFSEDAYRVWEKALAEL